MKTLLRVFIHKSLRISSFENPNYASLSLLSYSRLNHLRFGISYKFITLMITCLNLRLVGISEFIFALNHKFRVYILLFKPYHYYMLISIKYNLVIRIYVFEDFRNFIMRTNFKVSRMIFEQIILFAPFRLSSKESL